MSRRQLAPGPGLSVLLYLQSLRRDPLGFMRTMHARHGDLVRLGSGRMAAHLVGHHELADEVLVHRHENYDRATRSARAVRFVTGESILTTSGEEWKRRRGTLQPAFQSSAVRDIAPLVARKSEDMLSAWRDGEVIDAGGEMTHLTFAIAGEAFFGADVEPYAGEIEEMVPVILAEAFRRATDIIPTQHFRRTAARRFDAATQRLAEIVDRVVSQGGRGSLIAALLARDEYGAAELTAEEVRNETVALLLAGHETTANALTWCLRLLAQHAEVQEAAIAEVRGVLGTSTPTIADLEHLPLLHAIVLETLRLYPPVWIVERRAIEDDVLGGYVIPAGSTVYVSPYSLHRDARFWSEPERFDPARFRDTLRQRRDSFLPFGAGPHHCIGAHFAMVEARLVLATILQRFSVTCADERPVVPDAWITLRPGSAVRVRILSAES